MLYHSSTLLLPCWKLVSKSKWALTSLDCGLQNSSNLSHIVSKYKSSLGKLQDMYWSIPKSPLQAITFLHFYFSGRASSLHSGMFSHLNIYIRKWWSSKKVIIYCPIHSWAFNSRHIHAWNNLVHWMCGGHQGWMEGNLSILL